jgi:glutamate:Na+ symporter, ESS family
MSLLIVAPQPFWAFDFYWSQIIQFSIIMAILLLANVLRRKVRWLKASLLPVAVIGGFLGLLIKYLFNGSPISIANLTVEDISLFNADTLSSFTYHAIAIGFGALTLKGIDQLNQGPMRKRPRAVKSGMVIVNSYLIQGIFGLVVSILLSFVFINIPTYAGFLLPMGYGQGPGQALNVGFIFQTEGFEFGRDFGLSIASIGFLAASIGGVIYLRKLKNKGLLKTVEDTSMESKQESTILEGNGQIPLVDAVDKLTIQIAIIFFVYGLAWLFIYVLEQWILLSEVEFLIRNLLWFL